MRGVTIRDRNERRPGLSFDLRDVLLLLPAEFRNSSWTLSGIEAVGKSAMKLHELADKEGRIAGSELAALSEGIEQTIDGLFEAYQGEQQIPWLRIRAVDGSAFDVESEEEAVLSAIRKRFNDVTAIQI